MQLVFKYSPVNLGYKELICNTLPSGRKYITPEGKSYPSITTVLGYESKDSINEWRERVGEVEANRVSTLASNRGTAVHDMMEKYIKGETIDVKRLNPLMKKSFLGLKRVLDERLSEVFAQEVPLYSDYLGIAGRVDLVGIFDGVRTVIDFKTSSREKKREWISSYFKQGSGYCVMFEERTKLPVNNIAIIIDSDDLDRPTVFKEKRDTWIKPLMLTIKKYNEAVHK